VYSLWGQIENIIVCEYHHRLKAEPIFVLGNNGTATMHQKDEIQFMNAIT
jgi:hypothetical protein